MNVLHLLSTCLALVLLAACGTADDEAVTPVTRPNALQQALGGGGGEGYARAETVRALEFPRDHGPHPRFRNEWWYYTGVLQTATGRQFGFELTFFRVALQAQPLTGNAWRSNQIYFAHFAVTDVAEARFYAFERVSRPADGLAGARAEPFAVWLEDWQVAGEDTWALQASEAQVSLRLSLRPQRPPVLNGERGLSRKSAAAGNASYYYSVPRLLADGELRVGSSSYQLGGPVWLDREWSTSALGGEQVGWDWFALHLDDGSNLMLYQLRDRRGAADPFSAGTWSFANGEVVHLPAGAFRAQPRVFWTAPDTARYPIGWDVVLPDYQVRLAVRALQEDQWLNFTVPYWEGAVAVTGERAGRPLQGVGYLELTGYSTR